MPRDPHALPHPPEGPPARLPPLGVQPPVESWRIHREEDPLRPRRYASGRFRFDAPNGEFPVTYVNLDRYACYAEVFGDSQEIPPLAASRRRSRIRPRRDLRLVALDQAAVQKAFGLDLNICASRDYERTQAWSRAWHAWYSDADGIRYVGRHAVEKHNLCLFLDRCGADLEMVFEGHLEDLRHDGLVAAHKYSLAPRLFLP